MRAVDPHSALPLYHQIAAIIRDRIAAGELAVGDALESMRDAASRYGVNLHTVRHAYLALSRDGLVEMRGARGTRVVSDAVPSVPDPVDPSLRAFVDEVTATAASRFGLTAAELARHISEPRSMDASARPEVSVVECSEWQCRAHVDEITRGFDVAARPHLIHADRPPGCDLVVATWFHYNDVRRRWPDLLHRVEFLTIRPDLSALSDVSAPTWWVVETDEATAGAVAGDLTAVLDGRAVEVRPHVRADPAAAVGELPGDDPVLFAPRVWAGLDAAVREHPRAFELCYAFDAGELEALAKRRRWRRRPAPSAVATSDS